MTELLEQTTSSDKKTRREFSLVCIYVPQFPAYEALMGAKIIDAIRSKMKQRIADMLGASVFATEIRGSQEIIAAIEPPDNATHLQQTLEHMVNHLQEPYTITDDSQTSSGADAAIEKTVLVRPFIGGVFDTNNGPGNPVECARLAAEQASHERHGNAVIYSWRLFQDNQHQVRLEQALMGAIADEGVDLHYQPQIDSRTGLIRGFLSHIRTQSPLFSEDEKPDYLFGVAKRLHLEESLCTLLVRKAADMLALLDEMAKGHKMQITLSLPDTVVGRCSDHIVSLAESFKDPQKFVINIIESGREGELQRGQLVRAVDTIRDAGIRISLRGSGQHSKDPSQPSNIIFDELIINRTATKGMMTNADDFEAVKSLAKFSQTTGVPVIAEGIEAPEQFKALQVLGPVICVGSLLCGPVSAQQAIAQAQRVVKMVRAKEH